MRQPWRLALAERRGEEVDPEAMDEFERWAEGAIQKGRKADEDDIGEDDIDEGEDGSARERRKQMDDEIVGSPVRSSGIFSLICGCLCCAVLCCVVSGLCQCQYIYGLDQSPEAVLSYSEKLQTVQKLLQQHKARERDSETERETHLHVSRVSVRRACVCVLFGAHCQANGHRTLVFSRSTTL